MQKLLRGSELVMVYVSCLSTFVLMLLTTADAGGRYLFNRPITGAYEITTNYLMIAAVFLRYATAIEQALTSGSPFSRTACLARGGSM